jgi:FkbM family methyltransferase
VVVRRSHLGETLNAARHAAWIERSGIRTVIDVGAHAGEFASGIRTVLPDCTLYCFEPQPQPFARLEHRFRRDATVHTFNLALGSAPGETVLHQSSFTKASSLLPMADLHRQAYAWSAGGSDITVRVDTLDNVLPRDVERAVLLKLDVQGFELEVLRGASANLARTDYVLVETSVGGTLYEGEATFGEVHALLVQAGFRYAGVWDQMNDPRTDAPLQIDALFVRAEITGGSRASTERG